MVGKLVRSEVAQSRLSNSAADHLHFDKHATRIIGSGSMCS